MTSRWPDRLRGMALIAAWSAVIVAFAHVFLRLFDTGWSLGNPLLWIALLLSVASGVLEADIRACWQRSRERRRELAEPPR